MDRTTAREKAAELAMYLLDDRALRWALYADGTPPLIVVVVEGHQFPITVHELHEQDPPEIPYQ